MKKRVTQAGLTVNAISGTHCVFLGFDLAPGDAKNLLGFSIQREDVSSHELEWLRSTKTFASQRTLAGQEDVSSQTAPFQSFQWADYTAKPGNDYKYTVYAMAGKPGQLKVAAKATVAIRTELAEGDKHSVYFNRGAIASQAYAKRFGQVNPFKAGDAALAWLARDLLPGILNFIAQAKNKSYALRIAIYETHFAIVLDALAAAVARGVDVSIVYGGTPGDGITEENAAAIATAKLTRYAVARTRAKIPHNKFMVLLKNNQPEAVWTGSMNWSDNAVYGQLNTGHAIADGGIAQQYLNYWKCLKEDPEAAVLRAWVDTNNALPAPEKLSAQADVFSPHTGLDAYNFYVNVASAATPALFMTFPFGMSTEFRAAYDHNDGVLRYALLDKYVNGGNAASRQAVIDDTERIRKLPNVGMALGSMIKVKTIDGWMKEASPIGVNVNWVHSKFMVIDPLGKSPTVITGSANWSVPSTNANDENMLVIQGEQRVAHIYFTEFMRVFAHHRFRESVSRHLAATGSTDNWQPQNLKETAGEWVPANYAAGSEYAIRRKYFSS